MTVPVQSVILIRQSLHYLFLAIHLYISTIILPSVTRQKQALPRAEDRQCRALCSTSTSPLSLSDFLRSPRPANPHLSDCSGSQRQQLSRKYSSSRHDETAAHRKIEYPSRMTFPPLGSRRRGRCRKRGQLVRELSRLVLLWSKMAILLRRLACQLPLEGVTIHFHYSCAHQAAFLLPFDLQSSE